MITRIVRMTFYEAETDKFLSIFNDACAKIRSFDGCLYLSLHQDASQKNVFYTISHWESERHLESYRKSELFTTTWEKTKALFSEKPLAYSLNKLRESI